MTAVTAEKMRNLIDLGPDPVHPMCPIMTKPNGQRQYVPWSFCDMIGLADRLPDLTEGANKWITALEENTAGITLALGDIKALLMNIIGKHSTEEILLGAGLNALIGGNTADHVGFNRTPQPKSGTSPDAEGPFKVTLTTPTALKVQGKTVWFHLNHCCRANDPSETEITARTEKGRRRRRPAGRHSAAERQPRGERRLTTIQAIAEAGRKKGERQWKYSE
ncbi:hypothetical protein L3Q82_011906 [Scortum barcoo]|uniref:Uncharacterized protein n=1 Tax=Scortum barcoo TaxID=214431 RepID=A0ACB8W756_9TELE|nr:hypothetical protein L3Q82_011906 [Scortum barcoo]